MSRRDKGAAYRASVHQSFADAANGIVPPSAQPATPPPAPPPGTGGPHVLNAAGNAAVVHTLKCWFEHFDAILDGKKRADVRAEDDRKFVAGDMLELVRTDREGKPTLPWTTLRIEVTHVDRHAGPLELGGRKMLGGDDKVTPIAVLSLSQRGALRKLDQQPAAK